MSNNSNISHISKSEDYEYLIFLYKKKYQHSFWNISGKGFLKVSYTLKNAISVDYVLDVYFKDHIKIFIL